MKTVNSKFIPRNHLLQQALEKAKTNDDYNGIDTLLMLLQKPFDEHASYNNFAKHQSLTKSF